MDWPGPYLLCFEHAFYKAWISVLLPVFYNALWNRCFHIGEDITVSAINMGRHCRLDTRNDCCVVLYGFPDVICRRRYFTQLYYPWTLVTKNISSHLTHILCSRMTNSQNMKVLVWSNQWSKGQKINLAKMDIYTCSGDGWYSFVAYPNSYSTWCITKGVIMFGSLHGSR